MKEKVTLAKVLEWLRAAVEAALADPGDAGDTTTALSGRDLAITTLIGDGDVVVYVRSRNRDFSGNGKRTHRNTTSDGFRVRWDEWDLGIPTGTDWLPEDFVNWMRGG